MGQGSGLRLTLNGPRFRIETDIEWAKVQCKYANQKPMYDVLLDDISNDCPIVYEIFTVKLCMTLTLTFRMDKSQM